MAFGVIQVASEIIHAEAVGKVQRSVRPGHDAGGIFPVGVDDSIDCQVPDGSILGVAEWGAIVFADTTVRPQSKVQKLAIAVEGTLE